MKAGRELDALVAKKVMGWSTSTHKYSGIEGFYTEEDLPAYSVEMHDVQKVIEKMRADGFSFKAWQPAKELGECAKVSFVCSAGPCPRHGTDFHNHHGAYDVEDETLPLAICNAALIALKAMPSNKPF